MIRLGWNDAQGLAEILEASPARAATDPDDLVTAALLSLFTDRRVEPEELPAGVGQGGWWGEAFPREPGAREGSRLWVLLARGRDDQEALNIAREAALEALAWMTARGLVEDLRVAVERIRPGVLGLHVGWRIEDSWRPQLSLTLPLS